MVTNDFVKGWTSFKKTNKGITFSGVTEKGIQVSIELNIRYDDTVRVKMNPKGFVEKDNFMLVREGFISPEFHVKEEEKCLKLITKRLVVEITKEPWQVCIKDRKGKIVFAESVSDVDVLNKKEVFPIGYTFSENDNSYKVYESITMRPDEKIYGFGEKFSNINKRGQEIISWTTDACGIATHRSYKNIPFFMSSNGYGIFINSGYKITYEIGTKSLISYSFIIEDAQLDYFIIYGPSFKKILKRYSDLTGYAPMPPKWSFGFWMSRFGYRNRKEVEDVSERIRKENIPCDVIHIDPYWLGENSTKWCAFEWDEKAFPNPKEMIAKLKEKGFKVCLWENPYVPLGTKMFEEGKSNGYFVKKSDGTVYTIPGWAGPPEEGVVDFTNPEAVEWYKDKHRKILEMGVAVFKTDFGEWAPEHGIYHNGRPGKEMHNLYPLLYNKTVFEVVNEFTHGRGLVWARSAYAGSQRYPVHWGGDCLTTFQHMACQLRGGLSFGLSGVPFYSHDIGGFGGTSGAIIYVRWSQFGLFSSHSRAHGGSPREPWEFGKKAHVIFRKYAKLRYRLLPYIYSMAKVSTMTGLPVMRPLLLEYQDDLNCSDIDLEYLFGENFLVAPVFKEKGEISIYLPEGEWVDYWTKRIYSGRQNIKYYARLDVLPLFVKNGSIIPMGEDINYVGEKTNNKLILDIYPKDRGRFTVYDEDKDPVKVIYLVTKDSIDINISEYEGSIEIWLNNISGCKVIKANVKTKCIKNKIYYDADGRRTNLKIKMCAEKKGGKI